MVLAWVLLGTLLLLFELHHLAFYALFGAIGSFAAALVALVAPSAVAAQVGIAIAVALVGVMTVRPLVSQAFAGRQSGHVARGVHGGLIGAEAITLDEVGARHQVGHVRLSGERWLAVSGGENTIGAGTKVLVMAVRGTTLEVWPIDDPALPGLPMRDEAPDGADGGTS